MIFKYLIEKEFKQIGRNKFLPRVAVLMPFMALLFIPLVANFSMRNIKLTVVDYSHSAYSVKLINKVISSGYFILSNKASSHTEALEDVEMDRSDIILEIPPRFEEDLVREQKGEIMILANAVNGMKGGLSSMYLSGIVADYSQDVRDEWITVEKSNLIPKIDVVPKYNFNPNLEYRYTMIPAIMMMMLAMITGFIPALNIVSEKEKGTIEQLNVTPVKKHQIILAKLIPFWVMGFIVLTVAFLVALGFYGQVSKGGYALIYLFAAVFVLAFSGFGLMISNYASSIQQAMFMIFFFVITFIFLSGLYTPVGSMPEWLQIFSRMSPLRYMVEVLRSVYLKGSTFMDLRMHFLALWGFAILFNAWAVVSYRKRS